MKWLAICIVLTGCAMDESTIEHIPFMSPHDVDLRQAAAINRKRQECLDEGKIPEPDANTFETICVQPVDRSQVE